MLPILANNSLIINANPLGDREMMSECHDDGRKLIFIEYLLDQALLVSPQCAVEEYP